jgi:hypothetical protein
MTKEIQEIIEKNLPSQVGEILKKTLEQGQKNEQIVEQQKKEIAKLNSYISNLDKIILNYKEFDTQNSKLEIREKIVAETERNQIITQKTFENKELEKRSNDLFTLVSLLVKNPRAIEILTSASFGNQETSDGQYGGIRQFSNSKTTNGTKETTETKE